MEGMTRAGADTPDPAAPHREGKALLRGSLAAYASVAVLIPAVLFAALPFYKGALAPILYWLSYLSSTLLAVWALVHLREYLAKRLGHTRTDAPLFAAIAVTLLVALFNPVLAPMRLPERVAFVALVVGALLHGLASLWLGWSLMAARRKDPGLGRLGRLLMVAGVLFLTVIGGVVGALLWLAAMLVLGGLLGRAARRALAQPQEIPDERLAGGSSSGGRATRSE